MTKLEKQYVVWSTIGSIFSLAIFLLLCVGLEQARPTILLLVWFMPDLQTLLSGLLQFAAFGGALIFSGLFILEAHRLVSGKELQELRSKYRATPEWLTEDYVYRITSEIGTIKLVLGMALGFVVLLGAGWLLVETLVDAGT